MFGPIARVAIVSALLVLMAAIVSAQEMPPLPATLRDASGAVCISVSKQGDVSGVYVLASTGNPQADQDMLAWVHQLRWPIATPGETLRDTWFPMSIGFGEKQPPKVGATCVAPPVSNAR